MRASDELKFSTTESFQLFTEGLRSLQAYGREAKHEALERAEANLEECARKYPADLLPKFYLGIVKTERGYTGIEDAIAVFQSILEDKAEQLKPAAEYNLAVALMRRFSSDGIATAKTILEQLDKRLVEFADSPDNLALRLQVEALLNFIFVRQELWWNRYDPEYRKDQVNAARKRLDQFKKTVEAALIPEPRKQDILAAHWNAEGLVPEYLAHKADEPKAKQQQAQKAIEDFERALSLKTNWIPALSNLARIYQDLLKRPNEAERIWLQVLEIRPDDQYTFYMRGNLYEEENPLRAIKCYAQAPDIPEAGYKMGCAFERIGQRDKAIEQYKRMSEKDARASVRLGEIFEEDGDAALALEWYRKTIGNPKARKAAVQKAQEAIERLEGENSPTH